MSAPRRTRLAAAGAMVLLAACSSTPGRDRPLDPVMATAVSRDGTVVAASTDSTEVALFDSEPLRFRRLLTQDPGRTSSYKEVKTRPGFAGLFKSPPIAFSPTADLLVAAGPGGEVLGWESTSGTVKFRFAWDADMTDLAFFPDGRSFVTAGQMVRRWSAEDGSRIAEFSLPPGSKALSVAITPDGKTLLAGLSTGEIAEFDCDSGTRAALLKGHPAPVSGIAVAPDGTAFVSAAGRFDPKLWKLSNGSTVPLPLADTAGIGKSLATASGQTSALFMFLWILGTAATFNVVGAPTLGAPPLQAPVLQRAARETSEYCGPRVAYSPDGRFIAVTAPLSLLSGEFHLVLVDRVRNEGRILHGVYGCSVGFSRDSRLLLTGGLGAPQLWNAETGARVDNVKASR